MVQRKARVLKEKILGGSPLRLSCSVPVLKKPDKRRVGVVSNYLRRLSRFRGHHFVFRM